MNYEKNNSLGKDTAFLLTGTAGFIGSCLLEFLNRKGYENIYILDDFTRHDKKNNWSNKKYKQLLNRDTVFKTRSIPDVDMIVHLGARTDTTLFDKAKFDYLNVDYSKFLWEQAAIQNIPFVYASSAATYGDGKLGFSDQMDINELKPLNPYGISKLRFDQWALVQDIAPSKWYGLKFFNVYGPNECHKGRMASVIFHFYNQILKNGTMKLFRSHHPDYKDGEQLRDFVYVMDVLEMIWFFMTESPESGLYNIGTGKARPFLDVAKAIYSVLDMEPKIEFIDTPVDIRDKYQYFTEADMQKIKAAGYANENSTMEQGVKEYVKDFLSNEQYY